MAHRISLMLEPPDVYPAVSQGALGIECRAADEATRALLQQITCVTTLAEALAERSLLRTLRAGCHAPLGAWTQVAGDRLTLTGVLMSLDGTTRLEQTASGPTDCPDQIGVLVADQLLSSGAAILLSAGSSQ
jgi:hydroxymethylbilane synthase